MKKVIVIAVMMAALAGAVYAQSLPSTFGWTVSPQSAATQDLIRSDADNFIRPDSWVSGFDKFFAMTSFANAGVPQLGYATRLGGLYVAFAYSGTFWAKTFGPDYTEYNITNWVSKGETTVPVYGTTLPTFATTDPAPNNNIHVVLGMGDAESKNRMGFRFSLRSTHQSFSESDFAQGTVAGGVLTGTSYANYKTERGSIIPHITWAMVDNLTDNGVKPYVMATLDFNRNKTSSETYAGDGTTSGLAISNSQNRFSPAIEAGLGGYNLLETENGFRLSADLIYNLSLDIYNNEYNYFDGTDIKTATLKGNYYGINYTENSNSSHIIQPRLAGQWSGGPLQFRFQLRLPVTLQNTSVTALAFSTDAADAGTGKLVKDGNDVDTSVFSFAPHLRLAGQWTIVPKLRLNMGGRITLSTLSVTTTKTTGYNQGEEVDNTTTKRVQNSFGTTAPAPSDVSNNLTLGVTFTPTDNFAIEAACGVANNAVSVFSATGLFNFTNLLVRLKF